MKKECKRFAAVAAVTKEFGIGNNGNLPWFPKRLTADMAFLKFITTNDYLINGDGRVALASESSKGGEEVKNVVIMGHKTWTSIPKKFKPMQDRLNIIISRTPQTVDTMKSDIVFAVESFEAALKKANEMENVGRIYILGGSSIYEEALKHFDCECVFLTQLSEHDDMPCDTSFPSSLLLSNFPKINNITKDCFEILKKQPQEGGIKAVLLENEDTLCEHNIKYQINLYER